MTIYARSMSDIVKALSKKAKMVADFDANPKSVYSHLDPNRQSEHVDAVLELMAKNPDAKISKTGFDETEFLQNLKKRMGKEAYMNKKYGASLSDTSPEDPFLHDINYNLEQQADDFLRKNDPEFFEELNQAMKNYDENITGLPQNDLIEYMKSNYDTDMSEAFNQAAANQYKKDFIKNIYDEEFKNLPEENPLIYHLSKDPLENASEIDFPETSLNKRYHNVAVPKGKYYFEGQHKPADYYHNILWNYINKGPNRDVLLDEFFKDILHKETPKNPQEKFNIVKNYKDALDKRRLGIDMQNKPYNKHKFNNMKAIEEYFNSLRPTSFEDFESKTLHPSLTEKTTLRRIVHPEEFKPKR